MRRILRRMYLTTVPKRERRQTRKTADGKVIQGTWRDWLDNNGPAKYIADVNAKLAAKLAKKKAEEEAKKAAAKSTEQSVMEGV